jgi:hypothetical protein
MKIFKDTQINYKFIFSFDVCSGMDNSLYLVFVSSFFLFTTIIYRWLGPTILPILTILLSILMVVPFNILFYHSRFYLISVYARAIFHPYSQVWFRHFYFIDVIQSFSFTIKNLLILLGVEDKYVIFFLIQVFPIVRMIQCMKRYSTTKMRFPHMANCMKYLIAVTTAFIHLLETLNPNIRPTLVAFRTISSLAGLAWDIFMDWILIRKKYTYSRYFYPLAVVYNAGARFLWVNDYFPMMSGVTISIAEVLRRFIWTVIRVEVEHLNNCDKLRSNYANSITVGELFYKRDQKEPDDIQ